MSAHLQAVVARWRAHRSIGAILTPDLLGKRVSAATSEQCIIVCAYVEDDLAPEHAYLVRDTLNNLDTDGWWFFNPGTFIVAFRSSKAAAKRASACQSALAGLSQDIAALKHLGVGSAEGPALTTLASAGHLDTPPLGNVVNEAFRQARKNAS